MKEGQYLGDGVYASWSGAEVMLAVQVEAAAVEQAVTSWRIGAWSLAEAHEVMVAAVTKIQGVLPGLAGLRSAQRRRTVKMIRRIYLAAAELMDQSEGQGR